MECISIGGGGGGRASAKSFLPRKRQPLPWQKIRMQKSLKLYYDLHAVDINNYAGSASLLICSSASLSSVVLLARASLLVLFFRGAGPGEEGLGTRLGFLCAAAGVATHILTLTPTPPNIIGAIELHSLKLLKS